MDSKKINVYIHLPVSSFSYIEEDEADIAEKVCHILQPYKYDYSFNIFKAPHLCFAILFWNEIKKLCNLQSYTFSPFRTFNKRRFERLPWYVDIIILIDIKDSETTHLLNVAREKGVPTFIIPCKLKRKTFEFRDINQIETIEIPDGYSFSVEFEHPNEYTWRDETIVSEICLVNTDNCGIALDGLKNFLYVKKGDVWGYYKDDTDEIFRYTKIHSARELFEMIKDDIKQYILNPTRCSTIRLY